MILYSLLSPPAEASANLLNDLYCLDATLTTSLEWRPLELAHARKKIRSARRHYFTKRYSLAAHMQEKEGTDTAMVDSAADVESERLGKPLWSSKPIELPMVRWRSVLRCTETWRRSSGWTVPCDASSLPMMPKSFVRATASYPPWFCRLPAQPRKRQVRTVFGSAGLASCLAPIFGPPVGPPTSSHLRRPSLAVFETRWNTPYLYDLFADDVGHTLVLGATGKREIVPAEFLARLSPPVQSQGSDTRHGRILSLAHQLLGRKLPGIVSFPGV